MNIPYRLILILQRLCWLLPIYFLLRALFLLFNIETMSSQSLESLAWAFVHGIRFDLYAIAWINLPFILFWLAAPRSWQAQKSVENATWIAFVLMNFFFIGFNIADFEFYKFSGKRITMDIFFLSGDIRNQSWEMLTYYWYLPLIGLSLMTLLAWKYRFWPKERERAEEGVASGGKIFMSSSLWIFIFILCLFLALRGGWQLKPIRPVQAYEAGSSELGALTLNTSFTLLRSKKPGQIQPKNFFATDGKAREILQKGLLLEDKNFGLLKDWNVILIVLESFGLEYTGIAARDPVSYAPFLKSLAEENEARVFLNSFANGRRSIDAIPSVVVGVPSLMTEPFISSNYQTNKVLGIGHLLSSIGYASSFYHGAQNGSMFFDSFAKQAGFDSYIGLNEYPNSEDTDGSWGVFDEPFFQFMAEKLTEGAQPFAALLFSLSSHHPYPVPQKYKDRFPKGTLEIHESIGYTDFSLQRFFETARTKGWFKKTLFVITADHTSKTGSEFYSRTPGATRVPLIFYTAGGELPPNNPYKITQHVDILPSVLALLGVQPPKRHLFGENVFSENPGRAYNFAYPGYWQLTSESFIQMGPDGELTKKRAVSSTGEVQETSLPDNQAEEALRQLQATVQYFNNGLLENNWYLSSPAPQSSHKPDNLPEAQKRNLHNSGSLVDSF